MCDPKNVHPYKYWLTEDTWKGQMHENQNKSVSVTAMSYKFIRNQQYYDVNNKTLTTQGNL